MNEPRMRACIDAYVAAWNEHDPTKRRALLEQGCSAEIRFVARGPDIVGRDQLDALMADFQARAPLARGVISSAIEIQHHTFRYTAKVEGGTAFPDALEVGECDEDGRVRLLLSFVNVVPPPIERGP